MQLVGTKASEEYNASFVRVEISIFFLEVADYVEVMKTGRGG
jgi:hypothetical protein